MSTQADERQSSGSKTTGGRTESQSAYIRETHRDDAEAGDASADVHGVRLHSNFRRRHGDRDGRSDSDRDVRDPAT